MDTEPKVQYQDLTEAAVLDALANSDFKNPIVQEVSRLIAAYTDLLETHAETPGRLRLFVPRYPIQTVALRLIKEGHSPIKT